MVTTEEYNRLSARDKKLLKQLNAIRAFPEDIINRQQLSETLQSTFEYPANDKTIYGIIDFFLGHGFLEHNSTSQIMTKEFNLGNPYITHSKTIIMPTNDTRYHIHRELMESRIQSILQKVIGGTHPTQQLITKDSFNPKGTEENHVSPEHQETNMGNSSLEEREEESSLGTLSKRIN
jgi:hypothetical protein